LKLRSPLLEQAEFFRGKALPPDLQSKFDENDAKLEGQRTALVLSLDLESDAVAGYNKTLERMTPLWAKFPRTP
jgi:hypothetical protein